MTIWKQTYVDYGYQLIMHHLVIIGLGNGFLPVWHQAITWTYIDFLSIGTL